MTGSGVVLLDGGMGRELQRRGLASVTGTWSAEALVDQPRAVRAATAQSVGAYANALTGFKSDYVMGAQEGEGGETPARADLGPTADARFARDWRAKGAEILGGCCGIGPDHIAELRRCRA